MMNDDGYTRDIIDYSNVNNIVDYSDVNDIIDYSDADDIIDLVDHRVLEELEVIFDFYASPKCVI